MKKYFAQLNSENIVISVHPIRDVDCLNSVGIHSETVGIEYCKSFYGEDTQWVETTRNGEFRFQFADVGMVYDQELNLFKYQQPYPSWVLNTSTYNWDSPIPIPELTEEQVFDGRY